MKFVHMSCYYTWRLWKKFENVSCKLSHTLVTNERIAEDVES